MAKYNKTGKQEFDRILHGKGYISQSQIAGMSYSQLTQLVARDRISVKELRSTYSQLRKTAMGRTRTVSKDEVTEQFGTPDRQTFSVSKNLVTTQSLLHELADVGKFLRSNQSTVTGLKKERDYYIEKFQNEEFDVDESSYRDFREFLKWFKASEFAKKYDSDSEEVSEVFNSGATEAADWRKLFEEISQRAEKSAPVRQY